MLKLVPNHSSMSNMLFVRSVMDEPYYKNFYVWNPGFNGHPINNWVSINI